MDIKKYLLYLEKEGWSELVDSRWTYEIVMTLEDAFPDITEKEINEVLSTIILN